MALNLDASVQDIRNFEHRIKLDIALNCELYPENHTKREVYADKAMLDMLKWEFSVLHPEVA